MSVLRIPTAKVFEPLLHPARYKGARGGRGSGKSHFFAGLAVEDAYRHPGMRIVCIREVQKSLKESAKLLIEDKITDFGLEGHFNPQYDQIQTRGNGLIVFKGMQDYNAESIKSLEGFDRAWVEEGQTLSARSLELLRPTIRKPDSEIWISWNPRNASDPVDEFLCGPEPVANATVVTANYMDNPWFPGVLEDERKLDEQRNRDRYGHIWLGNYEPAAIGAIWDRGTIHGCRVDEPSALGRIVVGIDPATENGTHGIVACGADEHSHGYVLEDASRTGAPRDWANTALALFDKWEADAFVAEINQGGAMVKATLEAARPGVPVIEVRATRGKHVRAEPISALYSFGRIHHCGTFAELEDQMCLTTAAGYMGEDSPDRMDAMVWGMTELFPELVRQPTQEVKIERDITEAQHAWMG